MSAEENALSHAWNYFALHAAQRITVFNFFVVFAGVLCTGLVTVVQASPHLSIIGVALGLLLMLLSFVFWKLDQRTAFLIKHAEEVIKRLEPASAALLASEEAKTITAVSDDGMWTYGRAFQTIFVVMALAGLAGTLFAGSQAIAQLHNSAKAATPKLATCTNMTTST